MPKDCLVRRVRVSNVEGLHLRAAALFSKQAQRFPCDFQVRCGTRHANAKSVWELLGLTAEYGSELLLEAQGPESKQALDCLESLMAHQCQVSETENCCEIV